MSNAGTDQTPDFPDWKGDFENSVQKEKEAYIREHRLTVWRDHDHMHTHQPDSIFAEVIRITLIVFQNIMMQNVCMCSGKVP